MRVEHPPGRSPTGERGPDRHGRPEAASHRSDHAPMTTRLDAVTVVRVVAAAAALALAPHLPYVGSRAPGSFALLTAAYLTATTSIEHLRRSRRHRGVGAVHAVLVLDALYLAVVVARTGGHQSPLIFLVYLHVVAVTLLVSHRVGLRVAVLHAGLLVLGWFATDAAVFGADAASTSGGAVGFRAAALNAATFLVVAAGAAACSSINERALRASRADLGVLVELGADLERVARPEQVVDACSSHAADRLGFARAAVIVREGERWWGTVRDGADQRNVDVEAVGVDAVIEAAWATGPELVRSLDLDGDPLLRRLLPGATNIVVVPLTVDGQHLGAVVAEWGHRRGRIPATSVTSLSQAAGHASLSLRGALLLRTVEQLATRDTLTGLANRRLFEEALTREIGRAHREARPLSLVILDLDNFKGVNDTYGHQTGDEVLRQVGAALAGTCRTMDLPARYGGEEFVVLLPDCGAGAALAAAERLRSAVTTGVTALRVTVSAGVATLPDSAVDADRLVAAADDALYDAKRLGRDRAVASGRRHPIDLRDGGVVSTHRAGTEAVRPGVEPPGRT